jgi:3-hydroxybutyrate dehydrogenase
MIQGKVAIVTGSTSGIGLAVARRLAERGAGVVLNGCRHADEVEPLRASLADEFRVPVRYQRADMSKVGEIDALVSETECEFGAVDILVNNAGIQYVAPVDEFPASKWEQILAINLSSNFYAIRAALPGMRARGWGRIVNIASAHGLVASPFKSAYVAAKHGVVGLTKAVALEVAETSITCNAICPGYVKTPLVEGQIRDQARVHNMSEDQVVREVILATQPNRRFAEADAIGDTVLFLCSQAADAITGIALPVDGGWTAR